MLSFLIMHKCSKSVLFWVSDITEALSFPFQLFTIITIFAIFAIFAIYAIRFTYQTSKPDILKS